jgi:hypothetical protein
VLQRFHDIRSELRVDAPAPDTHGEDSNPAKLPCAAGLMNNQ